MTRGDLERLALEAAHTYGNGMVDAMPVFTKEEMMDVLEMIGYQRLDEVSHWVYREKWDDEKGEMVKLKWNYVHLFKLYMSQALLHYMNVCINTTTTVLNPYQGDSTDVLYKEL